jgi:glycosyltransferase involved in cell wall biosynthesis
MKLGIVYHMPFWQDADGTLWEAEGSFARYVDSLAPYVDEISLCVPVFRAPQARGTRLQAENVRLAPLPFFDGPRHFYPKLPQVLMRIARWLPRIDVLHCRVPTPAAYPAFVAARVLAKPVFLLVVGDLKALQPSMPYRGVKKPLWAAYTAIEEWALARMARHSLTFANGAALARKHDRPGAPVVETRTTTISAHDISNRMDTCEGTTIRLLTVSRIDPRKGLRCLPGTVAALRAAGADIDLDLDVVGPAVGRPGEVERDAIEAEAAALGVRDRVRCIGAVALQDLLPLYRQYDVFVLPTLPGEGIPRVLLEAMAAGLPIVTTRVAGIPSLIAHEHNGLLIDEPTAAAVAAAVRRIIHDPMLRQQLIRAGYETARASTLERQAASMMSVVSRRLGVALRPVVAATT